MKRREQYKRKLEFIADKITVLPEDFDDNLFMLDALFYRLQVSIDAVMDVIAMLNKDLGITVKDDYSNIDELDKLNIFPDNFLKQIRRLSGLRNVIVHRYNKIEDDLIIKQKDSFVDALKEFIKLVEKFIYEKLKLPK
jgi:uncharacterized protein YutE (UPF0331/DUF86 family)